MTRLPAASDAAHRSDGAALPSVRDDRSCRRLLALDKEGIRCVPLLGEARFQRRYRDIAFHVHEGCIEVTLCLRGNLEYECGGKTYRFRPGDVFVAGLDVPHRPKSYPKGLHRYRLLFRPPCGRASVLGLPKRESAWLVERLLALGTCQFTDNGKVRAGFQRALSAYDDRTGEPDGRRLRLRVAVADLLLATVEASCERERVLPANRVRRLIEEMRRNPEGAYGVDDLSARLQMSASSLQHRFRRLTGLPPHAFLTECRMEAAKRMLSERKPVEVVAHRLGYASPKHFSGLFRRFVGCAPSKWMPAKR